MAEHYIGEIICTGFNYAPTDFFPCDGRLLSPLQYGALFSILGTTFGGNGNTSFALPDLRGVVPLGAGAGPNLTPRDLGERGGVEKVGLVASQLPPHSHRLGAVPGAPFLASPVNGCFASFATLSDRGFAPPQAATLGLTSADPGAIGLSGGTQEHTNMQPTLVCAYAICFSGLFPQRP